MAHSRRCLLKHGVMFAFAGSRMLTPAAARATGVPYRVFTPDQVRILESLGEVLVPGSKKAGLAHYIDVQLSGAPADSLLMIKYLGINPPYTPFYLSGLAAAERNPDIASLPPLFYFALRNDAIDVVYGTPDGYRVLGIPYMAHIAPPPRWQA